MQTFTDKELLYLKELRKRNTANDFKNSAEPLTKPMSVEERKLRSKIRRKCKIYLYELTLAKYCGITYEKSITPTEYDIAKVVEDIDWILTFESLEEEQKAK